MNMRRKICVVTGSRSEFGILCELMQRIKEDSELELYVAVSGMHLLSEFGNTIDYIKKDGFEISCVVDMESNMGDSKGAMALSVSKGITGFVKAFSENKPEIVVVLGDRIEMLAAAIASSLMNIPVAHIHGGDNALAGVDEIVRGAITKLSHIHFPATKKSAARVEKMGEAKWRIFMTGSPAIDYLRINTYTDKVELFNKYQLNSSKELLLVIQHPVTTESELAAVQMQETLDAIQELKKQVVLVYPNSDTGGRAMITIIEKNLPKMKFITAFRSLPHNEYLSLMRYANVIVGNSSSGIIEAPFLKLAVVNIGIRQDGRERAANVIDVRHNKKEIINAIKVALSKKFQAKLQKCKNPYGDGHASERIVKVLKEITLGKKLLQKRMMEE